MITMDEDILNKLIVGLCLIIAFIIGGCVEKQSSIVKFEKTAIQHNAGQYNPTTGQFEWLDNECR